MTSGRMLLVKPNIDSNSFVFSMETSRGGQFTVDLPQKIIESKSSDVFALFIK